MASPRVRIPPSPTGYCHVGTARMAILNYLFAKKNGGTIVFRSEDTDKERSKKEYEEDIVDSLTWLGLSWDEFYRQSERVALHAQSLKKLVAADRAYISEEPSKKEEEKTVSVVRLRNPGEQVAFHDIIRGDITFDTTELGDFVIARSIDDPLYHFAVVVDDGDMGITHVIRGEEHISNTPRQILIQEALGLPRPAYAHYPLHLAADRSKLSKRKGDVAVRNYREKGYLPEAMLNYIAHLGWTPPSGREILSLPEMIEEFDLAGLHKSGAVFDLEKLRWFNRHYLLAMPEDAFAREATRVLEESAKDRSLPWNESVGRALVPLLRERSSVWEDIRAMAAEGEFDYFFGDPKADPAGIPGKDSDAPTALRHLEALRGALSSLEEGDFGDPERIKAAVWDYATREGRASVLWPLRYALTGRARSPDPFTVASIVGRTATLTRIDRAVEALRAL